MKKKPIYSTSKITLVDFKIESLKESKEIICSSKSTDYDQRYFTAKQHRKEKENRLPILKFDEYGTFRQS